MTNEEKEFYGALEANTLEQNLLLQKRVTDDFADMSKQLRVKKYAVDYNVEKLAELLQYLGTEVSFKGGESLGLVQLDTELRKLVVANGVMLVDSTIVQAVYFFLSRHEGKTLQAAKKHQHVFKPVTVAYENVVNDGNAYKKFGERVNAADQQVAFQEETAAVHGAEAAHELSVHADAEVVQHENTEPVKKSKKAKK